MPHPMYVFHGRDCLVLGLGGVGTVICLDMAVVKSIYLKLKKVNSTYRTIYLGNLTIKLPISTEYTA